MGRFKSSLICFAALYGGYLIYSLAVVPSLEPQMTFVAASETPDGAESDPQDLVKKLQARLSQWFPPDAWELKTASKILETSQGVIILQNYKNQPDGNVHIEPCSIVFFPNADADLERQRHEAIVVQAPKGATLRFDSAIDLRRAKFGKLLGGKIEGEVTLRSGGKQPGPEDDLFITTSDLDLTPEKIYTENPVHMLWGANRGQGVGLHIELLPGPPDSRGQPTLQGVQWVQLKQHVEMQLHLGDQFLGGAGPAPDKGPPAAQGPISAKAPVLVASRGPFKFDAMTYAADFVDQVVIRQPSSQGGPDELWCDKLGLEFTAPAGKGAPASSGGPAATAAGPPIPTDGFAPPPAALAPAVVDATPIADPAKKPNAGKLEFKRLTASGRRVSIRSPTRNLHVDCQSLIWDDPSGWLSLRLETPAPGQAPTMREVILMHGESQILSPEVHVHLDRAAKQLRRAVATGPGSLVVQRPDRAITAYWTERVEVRPDGDLQWVSLVSGAKVASPETGKLEAEVIHLWLAEKAKTVGDARPNANGAAPPAAPEAALAKNIIPHHMEALRKVRIESPALTGRLEQLELWFDGKAPIAMAVPPAAPIAPPAAPGKQFEELPVPEELPAGQPSDADVGPNIIPAARRTPSNVAGPIADPLAPPPGPNDIAAPAGDPAGDPASGFRLQPNQATGKKAPSRSFDFQGRALWARVSLETPQPQLVDAKAEGGLHVVETSSLDGRSGPIVLSGEALNISSNGPNGHVAVLAGRPARIEGQGLTLSGDEVHLHRGENRLWIDGPGRLTLPVSGGMAALPTPGLSNAEAAARAAQPKEVKPLEINWQGGMRFDGQFAEFNVAVHARFDGRVLQTERVEVLLNQRINFSSSALVDAQGEAPRVANDRPRDAKPTLERITCPGPFSMLSETYDAGRVASNERMKAASLTLNQAAGTLVASGPGWIERIGPGGGMSKLPGAAPTPAGSPMPAAAGGMKLTYLKVDFQHELRANLHDRQVECDDQVRIVYGPTSNFTQIVDPERLGPQDVWMRCDSVVVREMGTGAAKAHELAAVGDVQIEGARFDASAARLLYDDAKDWLILEGDGRIDAVLKQRGAAGEAQPQVAARKINYWVNEDRVKFEDVRGADAGTLPASRRRP